MTRNETIDKLIREFISGVPEGLNFESPFYIEASERYKNHRNELVYSMIPDTETKLMALGMNIYFKKNLNGEIIHIRTEDDGI